MDTVYLSLDAAKGKFFEYSKDEKEGFVEHKVVKEEGTKTTWRKYYDYGVFGKLFNIATKESPIGPQIIVTLDNDHEDKRYSCSLPLNGYGGKGISSHSERLISYMPNLKEGVAYRLSAYVMESEYTINGQKKTRKNYGVSVHRARLSDNAVDTQNKIPTLTFERLDKDGNVTKEGDIPAIRWSEDFKGKPEMDRSLRDKYLWETFKSLAGDNKPPTGGGGMKTFDSTSEDDGESSTPKKKDKKEKKGKKKKEEPKQEKPENVSVADDDDDDDDDLPF